jgi:hypothetical protein
MTPSPEATQLARKLAALPDPLMRERVLGEYLAQTDPAPAVAVLDEILVLGRRGGPPFNVGLLALAGLLSQELLGYDLLVTLYAAAKEGGHEALMQLFLSSREDEERAARATEPDRELTLGHRKWMARSTQREVLEKLLRDPEPDVAPILLQNPRLVERDVVLLAARRPTSPELQWQTFSARRWIARYDVKRALVLNPDTPTELAIRLMGFLNARDLRLVRTSPTLAEAVRGAATRLAERSPRSRR